MFHYAEDAEPVALEIALNWLIVCPLPPPIAVSVAPTRYKSPATGTSVNFRESGQVFYLVLSFSDNRQTYLE